MKVKCPSCAHEFEADEVYQHQLDAQLKKQREELNGKYSELKTQLEKDAAKKVSEAENRIVEQLKTDSDKAARALYEGKIDGLHKETAGLLEQLAAAKLAQSEANTVANKKILEETERIYREAKEKADEENRIKLEAKELQLEQTRAALKEAKEKAERGSQQTDGEALEVLVERDIREECRVDTVEPVKTGVRGADIRQIILNGRGERAGVILWEVKNTKWQDGWIDKFKDDIAAEKASMGVIVVKDLPEKFGNLSALSERIFAVRPFMVRPAAVLLRQKLVELYEIGQSQKFSSENIEAFYNYLTSGDFKARLSAITETYKKLHELHEKDKNDTRRRWGNYEKQLEKMQVSAYSFIGELQGISGGEIGALDEGGDEDDESGCDPDLLSGGTE